MLKSWLLRTQRVLVTAATGGVGHFAVQFARHLVAQVVATASPANHGWLRELGADEVIDYHEPDYHSLIKDIDLVIDLVGESDQRALLGRYEPADCSSPFPAACPATSPPLLERQAWPRPVSWSNPMGLPWPGLPPSSMPVTCGSRSPPPSHLRRSTRRISSQKQTTPAARSCC